MSSTGVRIPLAEAERLAHELVDLLAPACVQLVVAGSVRRRRPDVGDVEIVAEPRLASGPPDLFGEPTDQVNVLDDLCQRLLDEGRLTHRPDKNGHRACGSRYKRLAYRGFGLDLFAAERDSFGLILVIRTGPEDFTKPLVTERAKHGWLPSYLKVQGGRLCYRDSGQPIPTPDEESVFAALGFREVPPEQRSGDLPWRQFGALLPTGAGR